MSGSAARAPEDDAERAAARAQVFVEDLVEPVPAPDDQHHLARVLRLRPGELVVAADGRGGWRMCEFRGATAAEGGRAGRMLDAVGPLRADPRPSPELTLAFAPAKGDRPEWVVQKVTELGIDRILLLSVRRSVVRWSADRAERALDRLRRISLEAAAQCRRVWLPELSGPLGLGELSASGAAVGLALAQRGEPALGAGCRAVAVGPEGGWDAEELDLGLPMVGLGPLVLRAETASVAAAAALMLWRDATVSGRPVPAGPAPEPASPAASKPAAASEER
jgi:16S rRNA (uracil1498-N3)-methyltransferase